jgi:hypothetical protein
MHHQVIMVSCAVTSGGGLAVGGCRNPEQGLETAWVPLWVGDELGQVRDAAWEARPAGLRASAAAHCPATRR